MGKQLVTKIRGMNPLAKQGALVLLAFLVSFACISGPKSAEAAVTALTGNAWRTTVGTAISATTYFRGTTAAPGATNAYTIAAGANRLLVVVLAINTSAAQNVRIPTVKYGLAGSENQTLTLATSDQATSSRQHTWIFYLNEAGIAAANGTNLSFTYTGTVPTYTGTYANAAVYTGVDQTAPILTPATFNSGATANLQVGPLPSSQVVTTGDLALQMMNVLNTAAATAPTITYDTTPAAWTSAQTTSRTGTAPANYGVRWAVRTIATAGTHDSTHTSSVNALDSMSAVTLKAGGVTVSNGSVVTAPSPGVYALDGNVTVDAFTLGGSGTVTGITVTGNANATSTNVSGFKIWKKVGADPTKYEAADQQIGSGVPNGTTPVAVTLSVPQAISANTNYVITYDIASTAVANGTSITVSGAVSALTPAQVSLTDTATAATILATTTVGDGAAEPANSRLWKSSAATLIDAFTLKHNGAVTTDDDPVTTVTVTMTPAYISGGSGGTITKFKLMEVISCTDAPVCAPLNVTQYGSVASATTGDVWNIPTTGLTATPTAATYYLRVTTADVITPSASDPSGTLAGYYSPITATVTAISHSRGTNKVVNSDATSASLSIDMEKPNGPATATAATGSGYGEINLVWDPVSDYNGGSMDAKPVVIRRSAGEGTPPVTGCGGGDGSVDLDTVGTVSINYASRSVTDNGLIDTYPTRYYYRVCAKDAQGNISDGVSTYANAKIQSICNLAPTVTLTGDDLLSTSQLIKSVNTIPFKLLISNGDIGTCPDVNFNLALVNELNSQDFDKTVGSTPETATGFPATVTLGTGGAGAPTGKTLNVYITGQPQANQLELYKFAIQVTSPGDSHGPAKTTVQVTGMLNDMPPIVHNSNNMGKFQYGSWGQTYTCATCHSNSTTNIKGIYEVISTPIGRRNVVFNTTSSTEAQSTGVYGNDKRVVQNVSSNVCEVCHHNTRQHQYSASKSAFNNGGDGVVGPGKNEAYNIEHHNSRDCIACHTHNSAFRSIYGVCGDCHGYKASGYSPVGRDTMVKDLTNALGPNPPNYGAHMRHYKAQITCGACHNNTNHGLNPTAWAGNNNLEMGFSINKDTFPGFNPNSPVTGGTFYGTDNLNQPFNWYSGSSTKINRVNDYNASCNNYCHGSWSGNNAPIWVGDGQSKCGTCHNGTDVNPPTTGSHAKHAAGSGAGLGITCNRCHGAYANYSTSNAHINGNVEWSMPEFPGATYNGSNPGSTNALAPTAPINYGTCQALYCHSNVRNGAPGSNGIGGPTSFATPKWGDINTAKCGSCHGCDINDPVCTAQMTSGSHENHMQASVDFDCHRCHQNGGTTTPTSHANGVINLEFNGLAQNTQYSKGNNLVPGTQFGDCSTSNCHGRLTRQWGTLSSALTLCDKCHGSASSAGGFYGTRGPDSAVLNSMSGVGVHDIHIQNPNSPRKSTFNRFTSYAVGYACSQCHNVPTGPFTGGHIDTPIPAEVPFSNKSSIAKAGSASYRLFSTPTYNFGTQSCSNIWCHGGGMDSNSGRGNYAGVAPVISRTNPQWNVPYLTGNGNTDCTKCHALPPQAPDSSYTHFGKTLNTCNSCHQHIGADGLSIKNKALHVNGVIDGGCTGCHGNPPVNNLVGDKDGLATPAQNALGGGAGAHNAHQLMPAIGTKCNICHDGASGTMPSNELEIGFNMFNGLVKTGTFTGYTNTVNGPKWKASNAGTVINKSNVKAAVCSNLYCHGGGSTGGTTNVVAIGGGNNTTPDWEGTVTCGDCHGIGNTNTTVPTGGSHVKHASADNGGRGLACDVCHGAAPSNGSHVDGQVKWQLDRTSLQIGNAATYKGFSSGSVAGPVPRANAADYGTCAAVYCHSNAQTGNGTAAPSSYGNPKWGADNGNLNCTSCHADMAVDTSANATGSHIKHANTTTGMGVPCGYCHQDGGSGTSRHADAAVYMNFTSYVNLNSSATYGASTVPVNKIAGSAAYTTCSNTFCHGTRPSPVWGVPGTRCNSCHSASTKASDVSWAGRHSTHYNYTSLPTVYTDTVRDISDANSYRFNCAHCHDDNVAKHSLMPASANSAARVFYGISTAVPASSSRRGIYSYGTSANSKTDFGFKFTAGSCNTTYCHSNGRGGAPKVTLLNWTTTPAAAGVNCTFCHDGKRTSSTPTTLSGKHDKHMNYSTNQFMGRGNGFNCVDCHAQVITNTDNKTLANKAKHVNAVVNYSGAKANKGLDTSAAKNGECTNVYCHSNGNPNAIVFTSMTGSKGWNGSYAISTCNKCHGKSNALGYPDYANGGTGAGIATANLHPGHLNGMADTTACSDCHRRSIDTLAANKFRPYSTMHLSGGANVVFNTANAKVGSKASQNTVGMQVTCSNLNCHGQATPIWGGGKAGSGAAGVRTCTKCHGDAASTYASYSAPQIAPGYNGTGTDTSMTKTAPTDPRVGAHQRHLLTNVVSAPVKCGECHVTLSGVSDAAAMRSASHWNYTTATITFGSLAKSNSHTSAANARSAGITQCSNIYCHTGVSNSGTVAAPFWNMTGMVKETGTTVGECIKCHAMPPQSGTHTANGVKTLGNYSSISKAASCYTCHKNVLASPTSVSNVFSNKALHVNGSVEVTMACNSCHSYDSSDSWTSSYGVEGIGAHIKHINYLKTRTGAVLDPVNDTFGGTAMKAVCGVCHTIDVSQHTTATPSNPRNIIFGTSSTSRSFGTLHAKYNGVSGTSSSVNPKSCSNTDCHYKTSPIWSTY